MKRLGTILFWSVIAAAFIGPGTVTTAAKAGAEHGYLLLWALVYSTVACLVLQEAAGRLSVVSGRDLGQALRERYPRGWRSAATLALVLGAVVLGCAAYEAGNILGGVAGAALAVPFPAWALTCLSAGVAAVLLWFNSPRRVAMLLSLLVAVMGLAFITTAWLLRPAAAELARGALVPSLPPGSALLTVGLVGTTVVPYNLFLGSGLAVGQTLRELRFGLAVAVILGGLISMAVVVVGSAVTGAFDYPALEAILAQRLGAGAGTLFGVGLFAAGMSSAVTAPLAAAITARSVLGGGKEERWHDRSWRYRATWGGVLAVGTAFGLSGVDPIPVIVLAQALNGVLLPVAAIFLLVAVNDRRLMLSAALNGRVSNAVMVAVTGIAVLLGVSGVVTAVARVAGAEAPGVALRLGVAALAAAAIAYPAARAVAHGRRAGTAAEAGTDRVRGRTG